MGSGNVFCYVVPPTEEVRRQFNIAKWVYCTTFALVAVITWLLRDYSDEWFANNVGAFAYCKDSQLTQSLCSGKQVGMPATARERSAPPGRSALGAALAAPATAPTPPPAPIEPLLAASRPGHSSSCGQQAGPHAPPPPSPPHPAPASTRAPGGPTH
jgi:hypothetical protein